MSRMYYITKQMRNHPLFAQAPPALWSSLILDEDDSEPSLADVMANEFDHNNSISQNSKPSKLDALRNDLAHLLPVLGCCKHRKPPPSKPSLPSKTKSETKERDDVCIVSCDYLCM